ncbi:MAG: hypothetical protein WBB51_01915 [Candidatus Microthrix parvicella]|jgi:hypothetical protein|nr:hypothetical protein [Acidimicrobiia bacterium]
MKVSEVLVDVSDVQLDQIEEDGSAIAVALRRRESEASAGEDGIAFHTDAHIDSFSSSPW